MIRYGAVANKMRTMNSDELLISRLKLLLIMSKARMKGYPMGNHRKAAIIDNARIVFNESLARSTAILTLPTSASNHRKLSRGVTHSDHLFLQRTQLLAVMMSAFASGRSQGRFRKKAMIENVDHIETYLSDRFQLGIVKFLKVA